MHFTVYKFYLSLKKIPQDHKLTYYPHGLPGALETLGEEPALDEGPLQPFSSLKSIGFSLFTAVHSPSK